MTEVQLKDLTAPQVLAHYAAQRPDHVFVDFSGDRWTYRDLDRAVTRAANGFRAMGVQPGQHVAYLLDNHADMAIVWLGLMRLGAVAVPVNTAYRGEFLRHQVADSESTIVIAEAEYVARVVAVIAGTPLVETIIVRGDRVSADHLRAVDLADVISGSDDPVDDSQANPGGTAMLLYTSGTTGPSKGCIISHRYILTCGDSMIRAYDLRADDVLWIAAPMYHFGCLGSAVTPSLLTGSTVSVAPRFSLSEFWPRIESSGATIAMLISTMVQLVAHAPDNEASLRCKGRLRMIQGAPLGKEAQGLFASRFGVQHSGPAGYGITEACLVTLNRVAEPAPVNSSGKRFDVFDVKIVDDGGNECPPNLPGLILVKPNRPHAMMEGYWNNPEATAAVFRDGWFDTGDIGSFDDEGYFYFVDRAKDYLRKGGENVSSFEVETAFLQHPDVEDIAVHAVLSDLSEDEIKATIVLRDGARVTERDLCKWSMDQVPAYAVPRYIEFRTELPKNLVGRVLKYELRDQGRTATTWDRAESDMAVARRPKPGGAAEPAQPAHIELSLPGRALSLAADRWEPAAGVPKLGSIVLLHGGGQTRHSWRETGARLAERGWTTVAYDARGHGDSDWATDLDYSPEAMVADLRAVASSLDQKPVLIGASLGGITSLLAEGEHPGFAAGLVLVDMTPRITSEGRLEIQEFMTSGSEGFASPEAAAAAVMAFNPSRKSAPRPEGLRKNLRERNGRWYWHWDPEFLANRISDMSEEAIEARVQRSLAAAANLSIPTLLVRAGDSRIVSVETARELLDVIPHARFVDVPGAGHMIAGDANDEFASALLGFLDDISKAAQSEGRATTSA